MVTPDEAPKSNGGSSNTRVWALNMADAAIRIKPRRPYTPYNLFYLLERELVVQGNEPAVAKERALKRASMLATARSLKNEIGERPEDEIPIPARYKGIILLPYWYEPNLKEKRKHRKTHGKISFKELTGIISKNWANIDTETKDYCTRVSEIGRKRYKETMSRYNASQKILQLKKEHEAMENAREQRMEQFQQNKEIRSPPRPEKGNRNPVTPDRMMSHHAPIVVTPSHSGYNDNRIPMFAPSSAHAYHHYGPPPPMPHSMPHSMQSQHHPPPMPYRQHHYPHYSYPQGQAMNKMHNTGHNQAYECNNNGYSQAFRMNNGHSQAMKHSHGHNNHSGRNFVPKEVMDVTVDVQVRVKKEEKSKMTHDEAMRLCNLMGNDSPGQKYGQGPLEDTLLSGIPSFDMGDHHSLCTENDGDMSQFNIDCLINEVENPEENVLDLIRGELLPLELGEEDSFPDFPGDLA
mmetsp:Transcript_7583/g.16519  ORF Transcript_7583/g.16519 Transcript_7583/m.16519 type:complete len:463 (+) Transcript_7583:343-1731(+)